MQKRVDEQGVYPHNTLRTADVGGANY